MHRNTLNCSTTDQTTALLPPTADIEKTLLLQVAQGDEMAFRRLFYQYHHHLGQYIYHITHSQELTEEIVQDVFLKVWTNRRQLTDVQHMQAWLFTLSRNQALNALRAVVREKARVQQWQDDQWGQPGAAEATLPSEEQTALLQQAIDRLPTQQKQALILSRYHHLQYKEIAQQMNISRETVKSYLRIAMASITKYISNRPLFGWLWLILLFLKKS